MSPEPPEPLEQVFEIIQSPQSFEAFNSTEPFEVETVEELLQALVRENVAVKRELVLAWPYPVRSETAWSEAESALWQPKLEIEFAFAVTEKEFSLMSFEAFAAERQSELERQPVTRTRVPTLTKTECWEYS